MYKRQVDNYITYYAGVGARTKLGLSLVETAGLPNLLAALQTFSEVVAADTVELLSPLGVARNNSQTFGASIGDRADYYSCLLYTSPRPRDRTKIRIPPSA